MYINTHGCFKYVAHACMHTHPHTHIHIFAWIYVCTHACIHASTHATKHTCIRTNTSIVEDGTQTAFPVGSLGLLMQPTRVYGSYSPLRRLIYCASLSTAF